ARRLAGARPAGLCVDESRRPKKNGAAEDRLRIALQEGAELSHAAACEKVRELEAQHAERRGWVWAALGASPLAMALAPVSRLAAAAQKGLSGASFAALAEDYVVNGWRCDRAAMEALASPVPSGDVA